MGYLCTGHTSIIDTLVVSCVISHLQTPFSERTVKLTGHKSAYLAPKVITARDSPSMNRHKILSGNLGVEYYPCRPLAKVRVTSEQKTTMMNRIRNLRNHSCENVECVIFHEESSMPKFDGIVLHINASQRPTSRTIPGALKFELWVIVLPRRATRAIS
jgi:hypothetical protein